MGPLSMFTGGGGLDLGSSAESSTGTNQTFYAAQNNNSSSNVAIITLAVIGVFYLIAKKGKK